MKKQVQTDGRKGPQVYQLCNEWCTPGDRFFSTNIYDIFNILFIKFKFLNALTQTLFKQKKTFYNCSRTI